MRAYERNKQQAEKKGWVESQKKMRVAGSFHPPETL